MNTEAKLADFFVKTLGRIKFVEFCETIVLRVEEGSDQGGV